MLKQCLAQNKLFLLYTSFTLVHPWAMATKTLLTKNRLMRVQIYLPEDQYAVVTADAQKLGLKNANRWAAFRLRPLVQKAMADKKLRQSLKKASP